jgi:hypothetical protein
MNVFTRHSKTTQTSQEEETHGPHITNEIESCWWTGASTQVTSYLFDIIIFITIIYIFAQKNCLIKNKINTKKKKAVAGLQWFFILLSLLIHSEVVQLSKNWFEVRGVLKRGDSEPETPLFRRFN